MSAAPGQEEEQPPGHHPANEIGFGTDDDEPNHAMLDAFTHKVRGERNERKMRAAQRGGENLDMGPGEFENQQVEQERALRQQAASQGAQQAAQAQTQQTDVQPSRSTPGGQGMNKPYPAQAPGPKEVR